jgi:hypothetical protein
MVCSSSFLRRYAGSAAVTTKLFPKFVPLCSKPFNPSIQPVAAFGEERGLGFDHSVRFSRITMVDAGGEI